MYKLPTPPYDQLSKFKTALEAVDDARRAEAAAAFFREFQRQYMRLVTLPRRGLDARIGAGDEILRDLQTRGYALAKADPALKARLVALAGPLAERLEAEVDAMSEPALKHCQRLVDPAEDAELLGAVEAVFDDAHVMDVACAYAGCPVELGSVAVQVSTVHATNRRYISVDANGLPRRRTHYFHIDSAGWPHHKVLIYLNDVGLDQGPFRYVEGSHLIADDFELAVRKANDKLRAPAELFMALPEPFRVLADFGRHMSPEGPQAEALLARERAVYDDRGSDLVVFDYHGVHRGGFVRQGARHILQCNFKARD